jgi:hypothetical protein
MKKKPTAEKDDDLASASSSTGSAVSMKPVFSNGLNGGSEELTWASTGIVDSASLAVISIIISKFGDFDNRVAVSPGSWSS